MTGNILLNGKKRRLDYGAVVSTLSLKLLFAHVHFDGVMICVVLTCAGLCDTRGHLDGNSYSQRNVNLFRTPEAAN